MSESRPSWLARAQAALLTLVLVAAGARLAWELLRPMVGGLIVLLVILSLICWLVGRRRRF